MPVGSLSVPQEAERIPAAVSAWTPQRPTPIRMLLTLSLSLAACCAISPKHPRHTRSFCTLPRAAARRRWAFQRHFALAQEELLEDKPACVHPYHQKDFETVLPSLKPVLDKNYVHAGSVITVLGGISILPLTARIIQEQLVPDRSAKVIHQMTLPSVASIVPEQPVPPRSNWVVQDPRKQIPWPGLTLRPLKTQASPSLHTLWGRATGIF